MAEQKASLFWEIDSQAEMVFNQWGHRVPYQPFLGCIGIASRDEQRQPGWYPHPRTGGNLDASVLRVGSSLFLPVEVEGALLSVGDAHAAQADGEVSGTAIECPMKRAEVQVVIHTDHPPLRGPTALCDGRRVTFGVATTLDQAAIIALESMLDIVVHETNLTRSEALAMMSTVCDLRVTQMVNPLKGVHAVLRVGVEELLRCC